MVKHSYHFRVTIYRQKLDEESNSWLSVSAIVEEDGWKNTQRVYDLLSRYSESRNIRVFQVEDCATIPIELPLGVEKYEVQSAVVSQVNEITTKLSTPDEII